MAPTEVTSAKSWKKPKGEELTLPSGNVCLVIRPGIEKLLSAGVMPDSLTPIALEAIKKAERGPQDHKSKAIDTQDALDPALMEKMMSDPNAINDIFTTFDKVTAMCVTEPKCKWHMRPVLNSEGVQKRDLDGRDVFEEIPLHERDEDILYTDEVDAEDKTFIFNFVVGGTRDIEKFREEYGNAVADVSSREDVEVQAE